MYSVLFRVKNGKLEEWKEWCNQLASQYKEEALETLREENIKKEIFLLYKDGNNYYSASFVDSDGEILPATHDRELNIKHKEKMKKCLDPISSGKILYELGLDNY